MVARLIQKPASEPVDCEESRLWAKIDDDIDNIIIDVAIKAAREQAEHITGRRFVNQVWAVRVRAGERLQLHGLMPVNKVTMVNGDEIDWIDGLPAVVHCQRDEEIRIHCGYGDAGDVPSAIKMWIWQRMGYLIENRDSLIASNVNAAPDDYVDGLLDPFIVPRL